ncbi:MAG: caspase family protein [Parvibaculaceae bacterium]
MRLSQCWMLLSVFFLLLSGGAAMPAETRIALIVGNGSYAHVSSLANPVNDAKGVARVLEGLGFSVTLKVDVTQADLKSAIAGFTDAVAASGDGTLALFYYAGHGMQVAGANYLIPVDADIRTDRDVLLKAVPASDLLQTLQLAGSSINVIILDACRDNPFKSASRSIARGLARVEAPTGSLVAYATAPGQTAADGQGLNSPYSAALMKALVKRGQTLEQIFKTVRVEVLAATAGRQTPWEESSLTRDIKLTGDAASESQPAPAVQQPAPQAQAADPAAQAWATLSGSDSVAMLEKFVEMYPDSPFAGFAKVRIEELRQRQVAVAPSVPAPQPAPEPAPEPQPQRQVEGWSCDRLWYERNALYAAKGFCFKTQRAIATFGRGCFAPFGKLSASEKRRVTELQAMERQFGCP